MNPWLATFLFLAIVAGLILYTRRFKSSGSGPKMGE